MYSIFTLSKRNKTILSLFVSLFFIIGCPQMLPPETVDFVDVNQEPEFAMKIMGPKGLERAIKCKPIYKK